MFTRRAGFTLLEVLIALVVITVALLGMLGSMAPITAMAAQSKVRGRAALVLAARSDLLRAAVQAAGSPCSAPASGSQTHADGTQESWNAAVVGGLVRVNIVAGKDSLLTGIACP